MFYIISFFSYPPTPPPNPKAMLGLGLSLKVVKYIYFKTFPRILGS